MRPSYIPLAVIGVLLACDGANQLPSAPGLTVMAHRSALRWSEWSEPMHLDPPVNSPARELNAVLSRDGLSLYFGSDRLGGLGAFDIWVTRRDCRECPWGEPVNLGPNINSARGDGGAVLSPDEHRLFFSGSREGGQGGEDIWVSFRADRKDDLGWEPAVNLGSHVNTPGNEVGPAFFAKRGRGATLYFARDGDIYQARITRRGTALSAAVPVAELNDPAASDMEPTIRADGLEILFWSSRPGGVGAADIWVASRRTTRDPWSAPQNLGPAINTVGGDFSPKLSQGGSVLIFSAAQAARPSLGFQDLWMSTRTRLGDDHGDDDDDDREHR